MPRGVALDLTGQQFGDWTALYRTYNSDCGKTMWMCECTCGTKKPVQTNNLTSGRSKRCAPCGFKKTAETRWGTR